MTRPVWQTPLPPKYAAAHGCQCALVIRCICLQVGGLGGRKKPTCFHKAACPGVHAAHIHTRGLCPCIMFAAKKCHGRQIHEHAIFKVTVQVYAVCPAHSGITFFCKQPTCLKKKCPRFMLLNITSHVLFYVHLPCSVLILLLRSNAKGLLVYCSVGSFISSRLHS